MVATWATLAVLSVLAAVVGLSLGPVATPGASAEVGSAAGVAPRTGETLGQDDDPPDVVVILTDDQPARHPGRDAAGAAAARRPRHHVRQRDGADLAVLPVAGVAADRPVRARHRRVVQLPTDRRLVALPRGRQRGPHPRHCAGGARLPHRPGRQVLQLLRNWSPAGYTPPGWDSFTSFRTTHRSGAYYDYRLSDGSEHGSDPADYSTDVLAQRAVQFLDTHAAPTSDCSSTSRPTPHTLPTCRRRGTGTPCAAISRLLDRPRSRRTCPTSPPGCARSARCPQGRCGTSNVASRRRCSPWTTPSATSSTRSSAAVASTTRSSSSCRTTGCSGASTASCSSPSPTTRRPGCRWWCGGTATSLPRASTTGSRSTST